MYGKTNKIPAKLDSLNSKIEALKEQQSFTHAQAVIDEIVALFGVNSAGSWSLINDSRGKIKANASWFELAEGFADRRAAYKLAENNDKNIDFKTFWVQKPSKSIVSWIVALTPNFEDEPYNVNKNVGIDFIIPKKSDRVIIALSNNYIIRTLELDGGLTPTQQNILIKWTQSFDFANKSQLHQILWDSFDLEPVNKEFYKEISSYFVELKQHLAGLNLFDDKHAAYFSSRLIGRLIFCWFIDKKGFINPEMKYFDVSQDSTNYYHNKLEKLFFATLNTPLEERGVKFESVQSNLFSSHERENNLFNIGVDMVTPFLNGGLFEERETDFVGNKNLTFPTDYFHRLIQTLNHYNFTTDESTSSFQQVAIDPEMLGRIFENLLAEQSEETGEQARKAKGAFYTPREIVDYMCRESLREYLKAKIPYDEMRDTKLELLLDKKSHEYRDQQKNFRQYLKNYKSDIIDALDDLKVLDPACGSGAFPMGMLQLLVQMYERLEPRFDQYETKVSIVKNNIYGVDIEPMAVEISRLRTWLSIIVDEEVDSNKVKPLPNLDFKFVCANSLIPLDQNGAQGLLDDSDLEEKLVEIREKYFNARTHNSKKSLKDKLNKLIGYSSNGKQLSGFKSNRQLQLESYQPFNPENSTEFFDQEFIFGQSDFDIVIGNPPYGANINEGAKKIIKSNLKISTNLNSVCMFIDYAFSTFSKRNSIVSFIVPKSLLYSEKWGSLVNYLLPRTSILVDVEKAFESVKLEQVVFVSKKDQFTESYLARKFINNLFINSVTIENKYVMKLNAWICDVKDWELKLLENFFVFNTFVKDVSVTKRGFGLQKYSTSSESKISLIGGRNISRFNVDGIYGYISTDNAVLSPQKLNFLLQKKIVSQDLVAHIQNPKPHIKITSAIDYTESLIGLDTVQNTVITDTSKISYEVLAALLNSDLINWYVYKFIYCSAIRTMHLDNYYIGKIPLPNNFPESIVNELIKLVVLMHDRKNPNDFKSINNLVYDLYEVDPNYRELISNEFLAAKSTDR